MVGGGCRDNVALPCDLACKTLDWAGYCSGYGYRSITRLLSPTSAEWGHLMGLGVSEYTSFSIAIADLDIFLRRRLRPGSAREDSSGW